MDVLRWSIAWGPVAAYLLLFGGVQLRRRPQMVSGARDTLALAVACAGLVMVGPAELFMPHAAATRFGSTIWALLGILYGLWVALLLLHQRPRLVVYHAPPEVVRRALERALTGLDPDWHSAGETYYLPEKRLELRLCAARRLGSVSLLAQGHNPPLGTWRALARGMHRELAAATAAPRLTGLAWLATGAGIWLSIAWQLASDPQAAAQALVDLLRQ